MFIHDFDTLCSAILISGALIGIVLFMREELHMKGMNIFFVIAFFIIANCLTAIYGLN